METVIIAVIVASAAVQVVRLYVPKRWLRMIGAAFGRPHAAKESPRRAQPASSSAGCGPGCSACSGCRDGPSC